MPAQSVINYAARQQIKQQSDKATARERGRVQRSVVRAREKAKQQSAQQRASASVAAAQQRAAIATQASAQRRAAVAQERADRERANRPSRARSVIGTTVGGVESAGSTAADTNVGSLIILVLLVMGGLLVFYNLVSRPKPTSTKLGQLSGWLTTLSTDKPLFTKNAPKVQGPTGGKTGSTGGNTA